MEPAANNYGNLAVIVLLWKSYKLPKIMALFSLKGIDSRDKISNRIFSWYFALKETRSYSLTGVNPSMGHQYVTFSVLSTVQLINK